MSLLCFGTLPAQVGEWCSSALGPGGAMEVVALGGSDTQASCAARGHFHQQLVCTGQCKAAVLETFFNQFVCLGVADGKFQV